MDKFGLFDFISKLSQSKEAQNSIATLLGGILNSNANNKNETEKNAEKVNASKQTLNFNSDVYRSPSPYSLYSEMIEKHDKISRQIDNKKT